MLGRYGDVYEMSRVNVCKRHSSLFEKYHEKAHKTDGEVKILIKTRRKKE